MVQRPSENRIDPTVFYLSLFVVLTFVAWGALFTDNTSTVTGAILIYVMTNLGWVFILSTLGFPIFMLYLAFSRYGAIRLGRDDERPVPAKAKAAGRHRREQDQRELRERLAGGHRAGRRGSSGARKHTDRAQVLGRDEHPDGLRPKHQIG